MISLLSRAFWRTIWLTLVLPLAGLSLWGLWQGYAWVIAQWPGFLVQQAAIVTLAVLSVLAVRVAERVANLIIY